MTDADIQQLRRFNRLVTQRAGALETSYLSRGRPLAEARLIFEIDATEGSDIRTIRERLGLDAGYLSRLLRSLERQQLVEVRAGEGDARLRRVMLTACGIEERKAYDALSDRLADSILSRLDAPLRARLVGAMAEVERLMRAGSIVLGVEPSDSPDACRCLAAYFDELARRFEAGFDPAAGISAAEKPEQEWFVVARSDGEAVGCGALRHLEPGIGEIKRLWVAPAARGIGLSRRIMEKLEGLARKAGFGTVRLDTNGALTEARSLYLRTGYREIARYNDNAYADFFFEKELAG